MGARVLAVEPIPAMAERLRRIFRYCPVQVEEVGAGRTASELPLYVCTSSEMSSFSTQFLENRARQHADIRWNQQVPVRIVTLDSLIEKYGVPAFAKIDVEGFEPEVLGGLSYPMPALSLEVLPENNPEHLHSCLEKLASLGHYEFNISVEETLSFELCRWGDASTIKTAILQRVASGWRSYGDIYARLAGPRRPSDC